MEQDFEEYIHLLFMDGTFKILCHYPHYYICTGIWKESQAFFSSKVYFDL